MCDCIDQEPRWKPTHFHKHGGFYRFLYQVPFWAPDGSYQSLVVYQDEDGFRHARTRAEFYDLKRFKPLKG